MSEVIIEVPVVTYQDVQGAIGRRWARAQVDTYLEQAIEYEEHLLLTSLVPAWEVEYAEWGKEPTKPTGQVDGEGNDILEVLPEPVKPVADMAARRACYTMVHTPLPEYTNRLKTFTDVFDDETYVTERTFDTEPYSVHQMNAVNKNIRAIGRYAPITVQGLTFDCDPESFKNIEGAVKSWDALMLDTQLKSLGVVQEGQMYWTLEDNSAALVTKALLEEVVASVAVRASLLHVAYTTAKVSASR